MSQEEAYQLGWSQILAPGHFRPQDCGDGTALGEAGKATQISEQSPAPRLMVWRCRKRYSAPGGAGFKGGYVISEEASEEER